MRRSQRTLLTLTFDRRLGAVARWFEHSRECASRPRNSTSRMALVAFLAASVLCPSAQAGLGIFEHGNGVRGQGAGGVSYSVGEEATVLPANPALVFDLGDRIDIVSSFLHPYLIYSYRGNAAGPDRDFRNTGRKFFYIPQAGFSRRYNDKWSYGASVFSAGLGPDQPESPYERFGGARRAAFFLFNSGISLATGYRLNDQHALGISLNLGYQVFSVRGFQFAQGVSETPDKVTDQGKDGSFNVGFTLG